MDQEEKDSLRSIAKLSANKTNKMLAEWFLSPVGQSECDDSRMLRDFRDKLSRHRILTKRDLKEIYAFFSRWDKRNAAKKLMKKVDVIVSYVINDNAGAFEKHELDALKVIQQRLSQEKKLHPDQLSTIDLLLGRIPAKFIQEGLSTREYFDVPERILPSLFSDESEVGDVTI